MMRPEEIADAIAWLKQENAKRRLSAFAQGYVDCLLWLGTGDTNLDGSEDVDVWVNDLASETHAALVAEADAFYAANDYDMRLANAEGRDDSHLGHDFALSRNRHGTGFWDRGLGAVGDRLHEKAKLEGERNLVRGDDGQVYHA